LAVQHIIANNLFYISRQEAFNADSCQLLRPKTVTIQNFYSINNHFIGNGSYPGTMQNNSNVSRTLRGAKQPQLNPRGGQRSGKKRSGDDVGFL
jgi:hypothetical protein